MLGGAGERSREGIRAALRELREWAGAADPVNGPHGTHRVRPDIAVAVVDALERWTNGETSAPLYQITHAVVTTEYDLVQTVEDLITVRDALQQRLTAVLEPDAALALIGEVNVLIDDLLRDTADQSVRALRADAHTDSLTGAGNRRAFERDAGRAVDLARRNGAEVVLAILDLDGLKRLNDTEGHAAGDRALRQLASAVLNELRAGDGFYRIGGDEFAVLLPDGPAEGLDALLARARAKAPSFSYGASIHPADGASLGDLLRAADMRLLVSRQGRGRAPLPLRPRRSRIAHDVAGAVPILAAVAGAEFLRQLTGVALTNALLPMWIGMIGLALVLGIPATRRRCVEHADVRDTARCAAPVAMVVLLVMATALVPVRRLGDALQTAALERELAHSGPSVVGVARPQPTQPSGTIVTNGASEQVALPPLPAATTQPSEARPAPATRAVVEIQPDTTSAQKLAASPPPDPTWYEPLAFTPEPATGTTTDDDRRRGRRPRDPPPRGNAYAYGRSDDPPGHRGKQA